MPSVNFTIVVGHLGRQPDAKTVGQTQVANLSVATSERWKDKAGNPQEKTVWHEVEVWGKMAEWAAEWPKGAPVLAMGKIIESEWTDKSGQARKTKKIRAHYAVNLNGKGAAGSVIPEDDIPF